jgi:2-C-methyl-D-erythritol 2,4-cyclodiphosphate synthase
MRSNLASALQIDLSRVSIKAKTNEKMGFTGRGEGLEAQAVILLIRE